jgi:hypothetical protein
VHIRTGAFHPSEPQEHNRYRFWAAIPELAGRYLRVVTLIDKVTIHNETPIIWRYAWNGLCRVVQVGTGRSAIMRIGLKS